MQKKSFKKIFFFLIIILLFLGIFFWWEIQTSPIDSKNNKTIFFVVEEGSSTSEIAQNLLKEKLIRNALVFKIQIKILGIDKNIQAGSYKLAQSMDLVSIAKSFTKGNFDISITIPEGLRKEEIAEKLEKEIGINKDEFILNSKEGYLFPDTYSIQKNTGFQTIINMMEDNFQKKLQNLIDPKNPDPKKLPNISFDEVITLASLVEREAQDEKDRPIIAGILLKRYQNNWPLEVDATVQYALGFSAKEKTWWKKNLTVDDLKISSLYNTRINPGFPPGPICNPGLSSIKAVLNPQSTNYWFYLSDINGTMHYSKTLDEHNNNIRKYLNQ